MNSAIAGFRRRKYNSAYYTHRYKWGRKNHLHEEQRRRNNMDIGISSIKIYQKNCDFKCEFKYERKIRKLYEMVK